MDSITEGKSAGNPAVEFMEEGNPSLFSAFHAYTEIADNLCPTLGRCAMYETLNEKELCKILDTDSKTGLAQEEAEKR